MPYDVRHALDHAEVAGWVLGVLDPDDARDFHTHLLGCDQCQAAVAEFEPVARGLKHAAPAVEPPADLAAKTIAAVQHAILAGRPAQPSAPQI
jgi:anti-sigma factor RsiW